MWVMTKFGFFSAAAIPGDEDGEMIQIRARRREDLDKLRERYMPELETSISTLQCDYEWRAYCTRAQWGLALCDIATVEVTSAKFKPTVETPGLRRAALDVWSALVDYTDAAVDYWGRTDPKEDQ